MGLSLDNVATRLAEHRIELDRFGVESLSVFGSVARGDATEASDLDLLVVLRENTFHAYMGLKLFLEDLFLCKVDLVIPRTLKPRLRDVVLREARRVA